MQNMHRMHFRFLERSLCHSFKIFYSISIGGIRQIRRIFPPIRGILHTVQDFLRSGDRLPIGSLSPNRETSCLPIRRMTPDQSPVIRECWSRLWSESMRMKWNISSFEYFTCQHDEIEEEEEERFFTFANGNIRKKVRRKLHSNKQFLHS